MTTRSIIFLVGDPYKPSFATVTGRGPPPTNVSKIVLYFDFCPTFFGFLFQNQDVGGFLLESCCFVETSLECFEANWCRTYDARWIHDRSSQLTPLPQVSPTSEGLGASLPAAWPEVRFFEGIFFPITPGKSNMATASNSICTYCKGISIDMLVSRRGGNLIWCLATRN